MKKKPSLEDINDVLKGDTRTTEQFSKLYELLEYMESRTNSLEVKINALEYKIDNHARYYESIEKRSTNVNAETYKLHDKVKDSIIELRAILEGSTVNDLVMIKNILEIISNKHDRFYKED